MFPAECGIEPWRATGGVIHAGCRNGLISERRLRRPVTLAALLSLVVFRREAVPSHFGAVSSVQEPAGAVRKSHRTSGQSGENAEGHLGRTRL